MAQEDAKSRFRKVSKSLAKAITPCLNSVEGELYAEGIIEFDVHDEMINGHGIDSKKADKLVSELTRALNSERSNFNPEEYLNNLCRALRKIREKPITDIVNILSGTSTDTVSSDNNTSTTPNLKQQLQEENGDDDTDSGPAAPVPPEDLFPEIEDIEIDSQQFSEDLVQDIKVLLMTATEIELRGIMGYLKPKDGNKKIIETFTDNKAGKKRFYIGKYGQYPVVVAMSAPGKAQQGPLDAINVTTKIMGVVKPRYVIAVGIGYGMDKSKTSSGDVIVSNLICDYTCLRAGDTLQPRGGIPPVGATLLEVFSSAIGYSYKQDDKKFRVHCCPFIARPDLIDNPDYKEQLKRLRPEALGGEMEGAGIMAAIQNAEYKDVEAIVIKAICDWGDGEKSEAADWKPFSSHAAARYVHHQMDKPTGALN